MQRHSVLRIRIGHNVRRWRTRHHRLVRGHAPRARNARRVVRCAVRRRARGELVRYQFASPTTELEAVRRAVAACAAVDSEVGAHVIVDALAARDRHATRVRTMDDVEDRQRHEDGEWQVTWRHHRRVLAYDEGEGVHMRRDADDGRMEA